MLIGYDFIGYEEGATWGTLTYSDTIDELVVANGQFDEILVDLDLTIHSNVTKNHIWSETTILYPKFQDTLNAGSFDEGVIENFLVDELYLFRTFADREDWSIVAKFIYDEKYTNYKYFDRFTQNYAKYRYAIAPVSYGLVGGKISSDVVVSEFEGNFITDKYENKKMIYNVSAGDLTKTMSRTENVPLNGMYPIVTFGNSNYSSGSVSGMIPSNETIALYGGIDRHADLMEKEDWLKFINNYKAKVLRMDNGDIMLVTTFDASISRNEVDINTINFSFTEIGDVDYDTLKENNLIANDYLGVSE